MNERIEKKDQFYIIGFKKRITLQFEGENHQIDELYQKLTPEIIMDLKSKSDIEPQGILNVSANFEKRTSENSALDQYIGVATSQKLMESAYDVLTVEPSLWAVFSVYGKYPEALQKTWADIYGQWIQSSNYELTGGPEILWNDGLDFSKEDYHSEIWIPVKEKMR